MTDIERETPPPPHLKRRVIASLHEREMLHHRVPQWARVAASIVLFASGYGMAMVMATAPVATDPVVQYQPRWLLTLYEDSTFNPRAPIPDLVREYSAWADSIRGKGRLVVGEKLATGRGMVVSEEYEDHSEPLGALGGAEGLFIIAAPTEAEALAIARSMPHLKHGGRIVVRRIEAT
jgi:hypothetical protein